MIRLYVSPSCASCRKAKKWLEDHHVQYEEKNIFTFPVTKEDIRLMLKNADNGFEDIISTRSKYIVENNIDIDSLKVSELEQIIMDNPSVLRRPIIVSDQKMQVGYNDDDIRIFVPRELRMAVPCRHCDDCTYEKALKEHFNKQKNLCKNTTSISK